MYDKLLKANNSVSVHFRNVQALTIELYNVVNAFSPDITIKDNFPLSENSRYNTRNKRAFHSREIRTVHFGSETLSHLAPKIWELVPEEIKNAIKKWKLANCPCRLCQTYIFQVGFVIQSEDFFRLSFINTYCTINTCTLASIWYG